MPIESKPIIDLFVLQDALEGVAIRSVLESFGTMVRCHFIGNVKDFVSLLSDTAALNKIVIISSHGDTEGLTLPELHKEIEKEMPYQRLLTSTDFAEFLKFKDQIVLSTGCFLGRENFANSFIQSGAKAYLGFESEEEGNDVMFSVLSFLYFYVIKENTIQNAFEKANSQGDKTSFKLYMKKM